MSTLVHRGGIIVAVLAIVTACNNNNGPKRHAVAPDGACTTGYLSVNGAAASGSVNGSATSCRFYAAYSSGSDSSYSASYGITVTAGTLYQIRDSLPATQAGDASIVLVGANPADTAQRIVLAEATGEDPYGNEDGIWFYAPTSGTYSVRLSNESTTDTAFSYSVSAVSCPVVATLAATDSSYGDSARVLNQTGCKQLFQFFTQTTDSSQVNYYLVNYAAGQVRYINVYSTAFSAGYEIGGYGFNSMADVDQPGSNGASDSGQTANSFDGVQSDSAGMYVLAVGSAPYGGSGTYDLTILPASELPPERVPSAGGPRIESLRGQRARARPGQQARAISHLQRVHVLR
jgi:hypothetical protein